MMFQRFHRLVFLILLLSLYCDLSLHSAENKDQSKQAIYFYNPETNINNFTSLKIAFDTYLGNYKNFTFQPFDDKRVFENSIIKHRAGVLILSSWHFQSLQQLLDIKPVLVGLDDGKATQRKVLTAGKVISNLEQLRGKTIAVSGSERYSRSILREILQQIDSINTDELTLILVPKDIDALLAVGFGMASAALTSETSLEKLKLINPKQYSQLHILGISTETFLTIVAVPHNSSKDIQTILDILSEMGNTEDGRKKLNMLGLDGWRKLMPSETGKLQTLRKEISK